MRLRMRRTRSSAWRMAPTAISRKSKPSSSSSASSSTLTASTCSGGGPPPPPPPPLALRWGSAPAALHLHLRHLHRPLLPRPAGREFQELGGFLGKEQLPVPGAHWRHYAPLVTPPGPSLPAQGWRHRLRLGPPLPGTFLISRI